MHEKTKLLDVKVMVGGAPVNQAFCDEIEADYYTDDAASATDIAKSILGVELLDMCNDSSINAKEVIKACQ